MKPRDKPPSVNWESIVVVIIKLPVTPQQVNRISVVVVIIKLPVNPNRLTGYLL
jgi:hypothetical protein